ncbi:unnamed protein product [Trifolium pratense]|uniref:Uncharacterized protein n=1 Tax=Trifolium pratense TaxID=57577 RepID=A0ACB0JSR4_TRIPR|nr:unnamed protein product [Trifolium pratense]
MDSPPRTPPITTPRTPISPSTPRTPSITTPRTPPLSSSSLAAVVTPSPPGAPMKQGKIYSTPMLQLMDKIIQGGELLLVEYRRNQNTAEARENERKRKIRIAEFKKKSGGLRARLARQANTAMLGKLAWVKKIHMLDMIFLIVILFMFMRLDLIVRAARTRPNMLVQVGLEHRHMPPVAKLIEIVSRRSLGHDRMVSIREHRFPFLVTFRFYTTN